MAGLLLAGCAAAPGSTTAAPALAAGGSAQHVAGVVGARPAAGLGRAAPPRLMPQPDPAAPPAYTSDGHPIVYLTFDDGPFPASTPTVLELLRRDHARATFFLKGENAARAPELVRAELAAGDSVGDHTWDHPSLVRLPADAVARELVSTRDLLRGLGAPTRCFRPPFGETDALVEQVGAAAGLHQYLWTTESLDWTGIPAERIVANAEAGLRPGAVLVFHDREAQTPYAVAQLLDDVRQRGYRAEPLPC